MHPHCKRRRGATLIEAMATLMVFTIGILGLLRMNGLASAQNGFAVRQGTAGLIARDLIDSFERLPYSHPAFTLGTQTLNTNWPGAAPISGSAVAMVRS